MITGGVIFGAGAVLPWDRITTRLVGSITRTGVEHIDGWIVLVIAAVLVVAGINLILRPTRALRAAVAVSALVALVIAWIELSSVQQQIAAVDAAVRDLASVGIGIYVMWVGALIACVAGVDLLVRRRPRAPDAA